MSEDSVEYHRYCPGEDTIRISDAVCLGRRRSNFHKCPGCQFNDDEHDNAPFEAGVVASRGGASAALSEDEERMIRKVFKAYDVRGIVPDPLNEDIAWRIGNATAQFLRTSLAGYDRSDPNVNRLVVGRDMRTHSPALQRAFIEGAIATGTAVVDIGMIDTPQLVFAANHMPCCGGAQTTASHNPAEYNGFKICGLKGKPIGSDSGLEEIQRIASALSRHRVDVSDNLSGADLSEAYRDYIRAFLKPGRPLKVVVDASNGMAGRWFPIVFSDAPSLEVLPLNFEHNGEFVHPPNPLVPAHLTQLRDAVREHDADFGACFDGDADRCMFVDESAKIVPCDLMTALLASEYLRDHPGSTVVYDLRSSRIVRETIEACGGVAKRQRVGHVFMKRAMAEQGAVFGGELSGHFYFRDFWGCDSGMLAFVALVNMLGSGERPLSERVRPLRKYAASGERNFQNDDKEGAFEALKQRYHDARIDDLDGVTIEYPEWWCNVRASNTEPLLRLNLEADSAEVLGAKLAEITPSLGAPVEH